MPCLASRPPGWSRQEGVRLATRSVIVSKLATLVGSAVRNASRKFAELRGRQSACCAASVPEQFQQTRLYTRNGCDVTPCQGKTRTPGHRKSSTAPTSTRLTRSRSRGTISATKQLQYKANWVGHDPDDKWHPAKNLNAPMRLREFNEEYPEAPGPPKRLRA